jgi:hypothetical protein
VAFGDDVDVGVVLEAVGLTVEDLVRHAVRQRLPVARVLNAIVGIDIRAELGARDRLIVDVQDAVADLDPVAGQADQALDVVGLVVARQLEQDDVEGSEKRE